MEIQIQKISRKRRNIEGAKSQDEEEPEALCSGETQLATGTRHTDQPWRRTLYSMRVKMCADKPL